MPADELLLRAVVAEHQRLAGQRRLARVARSRTSYGVAPAVPRPSRADVWETALSAFARVACAS